MDLSGFLVNSVNLENVKSLNNLWDSKENREQKEKTVQMKVKVCYSLLANNNY